MKSCKVSPLLAVLCGGMLAFGTTFVLAQSGTDANMFDKHFVSEALKGGMAEVEMGHLAAEKGNSSDVRSFGRKMVIDHTKLGEQMKQVAGQIGESVPSTPTMMEQVEIKKLKGLSGDQFDQEYIKAMVKAHQEDLNDFKKEANSSKSSVVRDAASHGAEVISSHLSMIEQIAQAHHIAVK